MFKAKPCQRQFILFKAGLCAHLLVNMRLH